MAKTKTIKKNSTIEIIMFVGLCILMFFPPFFRGLFFERELLPTHIFSFALGIIWILSKYKDKEYKLFSTYVDGLAAGLVLMYLISILYAVNSRLAILEALKYVNYFIIYILARDLLQDNKKRTIILNIIALTGTLVALVGLGSAIGTWDYNGAYVGGRINSTFQYPNTLASYLAAVFILAMGLLIIYKNKLIKGLYGALSSIMFLTFILTYSRGMWLMFPFVILAYIFLIPNKIKMQSFIYIIANIIISTPGALLFAQYIENKPPLILWAVVIITAMAAGIITYLLSLLEDKFVELNNKRLIIALAIIAILGGFATAFAINQTASLTMANNTEEIKYSSVIRETGEIEPLKDYLLEVSYEGKGTEESKFFGRIFIQALDEDRKVSTLKVVDINDSENNSMLIDFKTPETMSNLRLIFINQYPKTSITFNQANILDENKELIKSIPLKYKYIPEQIVSRISSINLEGYSAGARLTFYKDAFKIIKDYPILGSGGGGWLTLYKAYQSYGYNSTQAHNYIMQLWIEIGTVGLVMFSAFILLLLYIAYGGYRAAKDISTKLVISTLAIATISIFLHAAIDFDLSLAALTFVLWACMGILVSFSNKNKLKLPILNKINGKWCKGALIAGLTILLIISSSFKLGSSYAQKAIQSFKDKNYSDVIEYFHKAAKLYPVKPEYRLDLANIYISNSKRTNKKEDIKKAQELLDNLPKQVKYNARLKLKVANVFITLGQIDKALELLDEATKVEPLTIENHLYKTEGYVAVINRHIRNKNMDKAQQLIEQLLTIKDDINNINEKSLKPLKFNNDLLSRLGYIQYLYENLKDRKYNPGKNYAFKYAYYFDIDMDYNRILDNTNIWNSSKGGNLQHETRKENQNSFITLTNDGEEIGMFRLHKMELRPNTSYKLFVKTRGTYLEKGFRIEIYNSKSENKTQVIENIKLTQEDWSISTIEFKTNPDIGDSLSEIRFRLEGKDSGYVDVGEVVLFEEVE